MKKLSLTGFKRARDFLIKGARPLEKALFTLEFEDGTAGQVLTQLAQYQNPDGGFGQALEPDVRTPSSSALCTEMGLRILSELHTPADHLMLQAAVKYLIKSLDPNTQVWRVVPADANDYPHAPWWHDEDGSLARTFDDYLVIPRAGILAALYHYAQMIPADWLAAVTEATIDDIHQMDVEKFGGGGDALVYTRRLAEAPGLPVEFKSWLVPHIIEIADRIAARKSAQWTEYCAPPLKLAPTPDTITAQVLSDCLPAHLDYLIEGQTPEGFWEPTWSWGDFHPADWSQAQEEWRGILTLDALISLRAFDRLTA